MAYVPGYRFRVSATQDPDTKKLRPICLYKRRYRHREEGEAAIAELSDGDEVEVLVNEDAALIVKVVRTQDVGYLG